MLIIMQWTLTIVFKDIIISRVKDKLFVTSDNILQKLLV